MDRASLERLERGEHEWLNIQVPVRNALGFLLRQSNEHSQQISSLQKQLSTAQKSNAELHRTNAELRDVIARLCAELEACNAQIDQLHQGGAPKQPSPYAGVSSRVQRLEEQISGLASRRSVASALKKRVLAADFEDALEKVRCEVAQLTSEAPRARGSGEPQGATPRAVVAEAVAAAREETRAQTASLKDRLDAMATLLFDPLPCAQQSTLGAFPADMSLPAACSHLLGFARAVGPALRELREEAQGVREMLPLYASVADVNALFTAQVEDINAALSHKANVADVNGAIAGFEAAQRTLERSQRKVEEAVAALGRAAPGDVQEVLRRLEGITVTLGDSVLELDQRITSAAPADAANAVAPRRELDELRRSLDRSLSLVAQTREETHGIRERVERVEDVAARITPELLSAVTTCPTPENIQQMVEGSARSVRSWVSNRLSQIDRSEFHSPLAEASDGDGR